MAELTDDLVPMLCDLQAAHGRLVCRNANRTLVRIVKGIQAQVITPELARKLFQLDETALAVLLQQLDEAPKQDLVDQLSGLKGLESRRGKKMRLIMAKKLSEVGSGDTVLRWIVGCSTPRCR